MNFKLLKRHHVRDSYDLAISLFFLFGIFAGSLAIGSLIGIIRTSPLASQAKNAIAWQPSSGRLTKLESFYQRKSFYYRVEATYHWQGSEQIFAESRISRELWEKSEGTVSVGNPITLYTNPSNPRQATWNPRAQAAYYTEIITRDKFLLTTSSISCVVFLLLGYRAKKKQAAYEPA